MGTRGDFPQEDLGQGVLLPAGTSPGALEGTSGDEPWRGRALPSPLLRSPQWRGMAGGGAEGGAVVASATPGPPRWRSAASLTDLPHRAHSASPGASPSATMSK